MPDAVSNDVSPTSRRSSAHPPPAVPAAPVRSKSGLGLIDQTVIGVALVLGALIFDSLYALLNHVHYADMVTTLQATPRSHLLLAVLVTGLNYVVLTSYDASGLHYASAHVAPATVATTSFIIYTLGNTIGLGSLTARVVRTHLYAVAGVDAARVTEAVAFGTGVLGVPTTAFGAVGLLQGAPHIAAIMRLPVALLEVVTLLVLTGVVALLLLYMHQCHMMLFDRWEICLPPPGLAARQFAISAADMIATATTLQVLMPAGTVGLPTFMTFYALAITLGVLSQNSEGLGVFEAVILLGCNGQAPPAEVPATLLFCCAIYFLLPLVMAAAILGTFGLRSSAGTPFSRAAVKLSPGLLATLTMVAGVMLLVSGVTPASDGAEDLLHMHVPLFVVEASRMISSMAGLIMLFVAYGLLHRLDAA